MSILGTKRRPISLDSDGDDGRLPRPKKAARMRRFAERNRPRIGRDYESDSSETLGEESDQDTQRRYEADAFPAASSKIPTSSNPGPVSSTSLPASSTPRSTSFTFDKEDYMDDEQVERFLRRMRINDGSKTATTHVPEPRPQPSEIIRENYRVGEKLYRPGKSVELNGGTFLRIHSIVEIRGKVLLRGWHFKRCETMNLEGLFPHRTNEICLDVDVSTQEYSQGVRSMASGFSVNEVKRFRMIRMTNHNYQDMSFQGMGATRAAEGYLFCRYKHIKVWKAGQKDPEEEAVQSLTCDEADTGYGIDSNALREDWRGVTRRGGAGVRQTANSFLPNLSKYTFGDGFCGAGGVSCGARLAGLEISWGFDKSEHAMGSYRRNYPNTMCETSEIADFLTNPPQDIIVDIIHCSPPCQTFSPAKTVAGPDDDANEACIFSVRQVVERGKPRIFTMEETSGLKERHGEFLRATIHTFIELGYSVRWKLVDCSSYGVPQKRKRLVIIASGPGEALPPFPKPTHGPREAGVRPYNTIGSMIASIPTNAPNHDLHNAHKFDPPKRPYSASNLAKTITCGGGENYHPSGKRNFTTREFACLQTFPVDYQFGKVEIRKQIGNAVPPMLAKALYREIIKSLEKTDGLR